MSPLLEGIGPNRPFTVKELSDRAQAFEWNPNIPFKHWLRTAQRLQQEADMYFHDGNVPQAYLLYLRYSTLVLDLLKTHPEAKTPESRKALRSRILTVDMVIKHMEELKPLIEREHDQWSADKSRKMALLESHRQDASPNISASTYNQHASVDPALSYASRLLDAGEHQDLAVELAQKEIQRRDAKRKATRQDDSPQGQRERRTAGYWENWTKEISDKQAEEEEAFRKQMESTRRTLDGDTTTLPIGRRRPAADLSKLSHSVSSYSYPKIAKSTPVEYDPLQPRGTESNLFQPPRPPKAEVEDRLPLAPERPAKVAQIYELLSHQDSAVGDPREPPSLPPKIADSYTEPTQKQHGVAFKPAAYLENGEPIRPIFLPSQLRHHFLDIASENTKRGLEMCGILCGTAVNNALFVRCLLIPEQKCTSDTCETENEGTMLEYCIEEDLLMLGWIHTHPTQTCFMSSRDLHTQSGYQVMLPESIAIVCAPKFEPSYGIFRLTNPPGLPHILECTQSATFHAHSVDNLYTGAGHPPGHVYEHDNLEFFVQDIRPGSRKKTVSNKKF